MTSDGISTKNGFKVISVGTNNIEWDIDSEGTITLSGDGATDYYTYDTPAPCMMNATI